MRIVCLRESCGESYDAILCYHGILVDAFCVKETQDPEVVIG